MTFRVVTLVLLISLINLPAYSQQEFYPFLAEVTRKSINVRAGQSTSFEKLCKITKGQEVVVVDKNFSWYKIELPKSASAYVSDKYVELTGNGQGKITVNRLNVRATTNINSTVLGQLNQDEYVHILESPTGWHKIIPPEKTYGWVGEQLLTFKTNDISGLKQEEVVEEVIEEQVIEVVQVEPANSSVNVSGVLKHSASSYQFQLVDDQGMNYDIDGFDHLLSDYLHYEVSVIGDLHTVGSTSRPVLKISKIELIL